MDPQRRIAERDAERGRSQRLEKQIGAPLEQVAALTQKVAELMAPVLISTEGVCAANGARSGD